MEYSVAMNAYRKLCTEFYDIDKPAAPPEAYAFYRAKAEEAGGPILEPMCGSGRFLIPLLREGFHIDGSDGSPEMLDACRARIEKEGAAASLAQQMLHEIEVSREYALVMIPEGSFCLVTDPEAAQEALRRIFAALRPGGRFVLDIERDMGKPAGSWGWGGRWVERPDGAKIICSWLGRYEPEEKVSYSLLRYELIQHGALLATEFEDFNLRLYGLEEMEALLASIGFCEIAVHRLYGPETPSAEDETVVFEARKPG
ncbi:class I SAM-dependent methyltransferase [bacterium]|nr:MAG: class I SAM-dependent methyltransferase [bacterium]